MAAAKRRRFGPKPIKTTDERATVSCVVGWGEVREEIWRDEVGEITRYNLAFIYPALFAADNGRLLGYDTAHGSLHRHFLGTIQQLPPTPYNDIFNRFLGEVEELRKRKEL